MAVDRFSGNARLGAHEAVGMERTGGMPATCILIQPSAQAWTRGQNDQLACKDVKGISCSHLPLPRPPVTQCKKECSGNFWETLALDFQWIQECSCPGLLRLESALRPRSVVVQPVEASLVLIGPAAVLATSLPFLQHVLP